MYINTPDTGRALQSKGTIRLMFPKASGTMLVGVGNALIIFSSPPK